MLHRDRIISVITLTPTLTWIQRAAICGMSPLNNSVLLLNMTDSTGPPVCGPSTNQWCSVHDWRRRWLLGHSESEPGFLFGEILLFAAVPAGGVVRAARWSGIDKPMMGGTTCVHDLCSFRCLQENEGSLSDNRGNPTHDDSKGYLVWWR